MAACPHCGGPITDDDKRVARKRLDEKEDALQVSFAEEDKRLGKYKWTVGSVVLFVISWIVIRIIISVRNKGAGDMNGRADHKARAIVHRIRKSQRDSLVRRMDAITEDVTRAYKAYKSRMHHDKLSAYPFRMLVLALIFAMSGIIGFFLLPYPFNDVFDAVVTAIGALVAAAIIALGVLELFLFYRRMVLIHNLPKCVEREIAAIQRRFNELAEEFPDWATKTRPKLEQFIDDVNRVSVNYEKATDAFRKN